MSEQQSVVVRLRAEKLAVYTDESTSTTRSGRMLSQGRLFPPTGKSVPSYSSGATVEHNL